MAPKAREATPDRIYYDGNCGLCHRTVLFVLRHEPRGEETFRFAPLQGSTFAESVPLRQDMTLPDSLVIETDPGRLLVRSDGVLHILGRLGGFWRLVAGFLRVVPRPLRDATYDLIARERHRLFRRPETACPVADPELRRRFDP